jgi:hypothetical protein
VRLRRKDRRRLLLAVAPAAWTELVALRQQGTLAVLNGHAAWSGEAEALCGIDVVTATPETDWGSGWLDDEWGPLERCPECVVASVATG